MKRIATDRHDDDHRLDVTGSIVFSAPIDELIAFTV
jgi:hypothetical protein